MLNIFTKGIRLRLKPIRMRKVKVLQGKTFKKNFIHLTLQGTALYQEICGKE